MAITDSLSLLFTTGASITSAHYIIDDAPTPNIYVFAAGDQVFFAKITNFATITMKMLKT